MLCLLCMFNGILKRRGSAVSSSEGGSYFFAQCCLEAGYLVFPLMRVECAGLRIYFFF